MSERTEPYVPNPHVSPTVDQFLLMQEQDPNAWWRIECGDHQNLFEELLDERDGLRTQLERMRGLLDGMHDALVDALTRYDDASA